MNRNRFAVSLILSFLIILSCMGLVHSGDNSDNKIPEPSSTVEDNSLGFPTGWSDDIQLSNVSYNNNESFPQYKINNAHIEIHDNFIHVIWEDQKIDDPGPIVNSNVTYSRSIDFGASWEPPIYLTYLEGGNMFNAMYGSDPDLAVNSSNVHVVWWQQNDSFHALRYRKSTDNGESWDQIKNITDFRIGIPAYDASIAVWGMNLHVVWREGPGNKELWYSNSTDNGVTWSQPKQLVPDDCSSGRLAVNGLKVHLVFNQWYNGGSGNSNEIFYMNSTDNGITWSPWQLLTPADGKTSQSFDVALENENIYIAYYDDRDEIPNPWGGFTSQIYYTNSSDGGITWGADQRLTYSDNYSHNPYIDVENGEIHIVWINRTGNVDYAPEVYYMNSTDGGVTWTQNIRLTYALKMTGPFDIEVDDVRTHVLFFDKRNGDEHFKVEVYYKRYPDFPPDPEYNITLNEGWNLISLPLEQSNEAIDQVLSSIDGKWDCIQAYDVINDIWSSNVTSRPDSLNDLELLNHKVGFWINITEPGGVNLTVSGYIPTSTTIPLYAGWNLVGYPSLTNETVANALWGTGADKVEAFDPAEPYRIKEVGPTYVMKPGEGYWVHVVEDTVWVIDW